MSRLVGDFEYSRAVVDVARVLSAFGIVPLVPLCIVDLGHRITSWRGLP